VIRALHVRGFTALPSNRKEVRQKNWLIAYMYMFVLSTELSDRNLEKSVSDKREVARTDGSTLRSAGVVM
jgi:hypothetical protein